MKLGGGAQTPPPATTDQPAPAGLGDGMTPAPEAPPAQGGEAPKPFDDEPFDANVEADENSDPKKFIEQLSGKLGQSLRKYTQQQGQPDFELEKFTVNSVLGATHTADMSPEDQNDIINKVNSSGAGDDGPAPEGGEEEAPEGQAPVAPDEEGELPEFDDEGLNEGISDGVSEGVNDGEGDENLFVEPKKMSMFSHEAGIEAKVSEGNNKKSSIFVTKKLLETRVIESLNQTDMNTPTTEPVTKPVTKPVEPVKPSRRNKPFFPSVTPSVTPAPKAMAETKKEAGGYKIYHTSFTSAADEMIKYCELKGYTIDESDWFNSVSTGPKKPDNGNTNKYHLDLLQNGLPTKLKLHAQVYGMANSYELNMYIN